MPIAPRRACLVSGCAGYADFRGRCPEHAAPVRAALELRRADEPGRRWYHTPRWQRLRQAVILAEPLCRLCQADHVTRAASEVDHIDPHRGDPRRFWSSANLQPLCQAHHIAKTRAERRRP